jgi:hypothetical protein
MKKLFTLLAAVLLTLQISAQNWPYYIDFISCYGMCDGTIYIDSTANAQYPLTYSIDSGVTWVANNAFPNLCEGNYTVFVNDVNGISIDTLSIPFWQPDSLYPVIHISGTGDTVLTAEGGMTPYSFTWQNNLPIAQPPYFPLFDSVICVTDYNGCITCDTPVVINACEFLFIDMSPGQTSSPVFLELNTSLFLPWVYDEFWEVFNLTTNTLVAQAGISYPFFNLNTTDTFFVCVDATYLGGAFDDTCRVCDTLLFNGSWLLMSMAQPLSITEQSQNKTLLKVTDVLGRKSKGTKNTPLFYIYDDGTVEKRIIIE